MVLKPLFNLRTVKAKGIVLVHCSSKRTLRIIFHSMGYILLKWGGGWGKDPGSSSFLVDYKGFEEYNGSGSCHKNHTPDLIPPPKWMKLYTVSIEWFQPIQIKNQLLDKLYLFFVCCPGLVVNFFFKFWKNQTIFLWKPIPTPFLSPAVP